MQQPSFFIGHTSFDNFLECVDPLRTIHLDAIQDSTKIDYHGAHQQCFKITLSALNTAGNSEVCHYCTAIVSRVNMLMGKPFGDREEFRYKQMHNVVTQIKEMVHTELANRGYTIVRPGHMSMPEDYTTVIGALDFISIRVDKEGVYRVRWAAEPEQEIPKDGN